MEKRKIKDALNLAQNEWYEFTSYFEEDIFNDQAYSSELTDGIYIFGPILAIISKNVNLYVLRDL